MLESLLGRLKLVHRPMKLWSGLFPYRYLCRVVQRERGGSCLPLKPHEGIKICNKSEGLVIIYILNIRPLLIFSFTIYQFAYKKKRQWWGEFRGVEAEIFNKFITLVRQRLHQHGLIRIVTNQIQVKSFSCLMATQTDKRTLENLTFSPARL